ncbi:MAG: hypothetical protein V3V08_03350 [Nannocystaceae bacterium]
MCDPRALGRRRGAVGWGVRVVSLLMLASVSTLGLACPSPKSPIGTHRDPSVAAAATSASGAPRRAVARGVSDPENTDAEAAHHVVFADRTRYAYVLLVRGERPHAPTRMALNRLVRSRLRSHIGAVEVRALQTLIERDPKHAEDVGLLTGDEVERRRLLAIDGADLLGLHVETLRREKLVDAALLRDPVLTRALTTTERASIETRVWALVFRADYRNQHAARGLRLLQTLVTMVAEERDALIFDVDTRETVGPRVFGERRFRTTVANVADQISVVPFPDPRHSSKGVRLMTRGMRRFGAVDLELDGLPAQTETLQRATHLLYGLAFVLVAEADLDHSGYAVEIDDPLTVRHADAVGAYGASGGLLQRCASCPGRVDLHLVERAAEPHDPPGHVVARIVAPRAVSDHRPYDHPAWVARSLVSVFGPE